MVLIHRDGEPERGVVEVSDAAVGREFQRGIGIQLREGGELLQFRFCATTFRSHADGVGDSEQELDFITRELAWLVRVDAENSVGALTRGDDEADAADDAVFKQYIRRDEATFMAQVCNQCRLAMIQNKSTHRAGASVNAA